MKTSVFLIALLFAAGCSYLGEPLEELDLANEISDEGDYILIKHRGANPKVGFIFYPGGLVDPHVYLCWMDDLVSDIPDLAVMSLKIPGNLAIVNSHLGSSVRRDFDQIGLWFVGGHSLGGVSASILAHGNAETFPRVILLASFPTENSSLNSPAYHVLSISGSEDGLSTRQKLDDNAHLLPPRFVVTNPDTLSGQNQNTTEFFEIPGGNHSGFGCYGFQDGDKEALISQSEQQAAIRAAIKSFINSAR